MRVSQALDCSVRGTAAAAAVEVPRRKGPAVASYPVAVELQHCQQVVAEEPCLDNAAAEKGVVESDQMRHNLVVEVVADE